MALELKTSATPEVRVVTDDAKTTPLKMALSDAAGALGFPNVRFRVFLQVEGIITSRFP